MTNHFQLASFYALMDELRIGDRSETVFVADDHQRWQVDGLQCGGGVGPSGHSLERRGDARAAGARHHFAGGLDEVWAILPRGFAKKLRQHRIDELLGSALK